MPSFQNLPLQMLKNIENEKFKLLFLSKNLNVFINYI